MLLTRHRNPSAPGDHGQPDDAGQADYRPQSMTASAARPFLRLPPFPAARVTAFAERNTAFAGRDGSSGNAAAIIKAVRKHRVGGAYWGPRPALPDRFVLVRSPSHVSAARSIHSAVPLICWADQEARPCEVQGASTIGGECDPWHMLSGAIAVVADEGDFMEAMASIALVPSYRLDPTSGKLVRSPGDAAVQLAQSLANKIFENPFSGEPMDAIEAIELCGFWRRLIDSNRGITAALGFAFWKQSHVAPLLWGGAAPVRFLRAVDSVDTTAPVAAWRAKTSGAVIADLEARAVPIIDVEDGFLRSQGLGADCVPPLSIAVDRLGAHFDPSAPSDLEVLIEQGGFDASLLARAAELRAAILAAGIGKYDRSTGIIERPAGKRRHILVPGQVEDDRAVKIGGCGLVSNLELLTRVRAAAPDAFILYKPHPDVVAGHRRGAISDRACLDQADQIVADLPIASLIAMADEVHVNTSLAGFEALLRGKSVTTYGVPFYAGWGLTNDLGPIPARRTARRSIDELVAAALLLYPRYLDPTTGLPCPAEVVVARLSAASGANPGMVVGMRRLQGKVMSRLRRLVQ